VKRMRRRTCFFAITIAVLTLIGAAASHGAPIAVLDHGGSSSGSSPPPLSPEQTINLCEHLTTGEVCLLLIIQTSGSTYLGEIDFQGAIFTANSAVPVEVGGNYPISALDIPSADHFEGWSVEGGASVSSASSLSTKVTVISTGEIELEVAQPVSIQVCTGAAGASVEIDEGSSGWIDYTSCASATLWGGEAYSIQALVGEGQSFAQWYADGGTVSSATAPRSSYTPPSSGWAALTAVISATSAGPTGCPSSNSPSDITCSLWAGYESIQNWNGGTTGVSGTLTVPEVSWNSAYSSLIYQGLSEWVGIGGLTGSTPHIWQAGVSEVFVSRSDEINFLWYEAAPAPAICIFSSQTQMMTILDGLSGTAPDGSGAYTINFCDGQVGTSYVAGGPVVAGDQISISLTYAPDLGATCFPQNANGEPYTASADFSGSAIGNLPNPISAPEPGLGECEFEFVPDSGSAEWVAETPQVQPNIGQPNYINPPTIDVAASFTGETVSLATAPNLYEHLAGPTILQPGGACEAWTVCDEYNSPWEWFSVEEIQSQGTFNIS